MGHLVELAPPESYDEKYEKWRYENLPILPDSWNYQTADANKILGFTAQQTLDYTQSLYEKKLVTYPRTDSRYLTEDMEDSLHELITKMKSKFGWTKNLPVHADRVIDNSKVTDHHAIIPTVNVEEADFSELPSGEQKILSLITARLMAAVGDAAVKNVTDVEFTCADIIFKANAKIMKEKGWREIQEWIIGSGAESTDSEKEDEDQSGNADVLAFIDSLTEGKSYPVSEQKITEGKTTPKQRYTEDSLLSAMERAGAEEIPDEVERKGIGTSRNQGGND